MSQVDAVVMDRLKKALELSRAAGVGCELTSDQAVKLLDHIYEMEAVEAALTDLLQEQSEPLARVRCLESELAALKAAAAWHPVSEPPEKASYILATDGEDVEVCYYHTYTMNNKLFVLWEYGDGYNMHNVTHWCALPELPNESTP